MKATGIVRRIDDLGKIVIPRDIRRMLNIRCSDSLEIFLDKDEIILKKYCPQKGLGDIIENFSEELENKASALGDVKTENIMHHVREIERLLNDGDELSEQF